MADEPPTYPVQVILDSGAADHVAARETFPGYDISESPGSKAGRHYAGASGHRIPNEGQASISMTMPAGGDHSNTIRTNVQIANVTRPLLSVSKICANGLNVVYKTDEAVIVDKSNIVARFGLENGLYVSTVQVKNPKCPGFQGQDR